MIINSIQFVVPPKYVFESDFAMVAFEGESLSMKFTVTSFHKMPIIIKHSIRRVDGRNVRKKLFETNEDGIIFPEVMTSDSGSYTISCYDDGGLEGKDTFELTVQGMASY